MLWPTTYGPAVISVLVIDTSADASADPPLPVSSVLSLGSGSGSVAETVTVLSNAPEAVMVAVTVMVASAPDASDGIVHGSAMQPPPLTPVMVRLDGVSVICTFVAVDGPAFATKSEYVIDWPDVYG